MAGGSGKQILFVLPQARQATRLHCMQGCKMCFVCWCGGELHVFLNSASGTRRCSSLGCNHWPWSEWHVPSLVLEERSQMTCSASHMVMKDMSGLFFVVFFCDPNPTLIDGLRLSAYGWNNARPSIHIPLATRFMLSHLSPHFSLALHRSPNLFFTPRASHLAAPPCQPSLATPPLHPLLLHSHLRHLCSEPSEELSEVAAAEFWSATLWSKKARQLPFLLINGSTGCG